MYLSQSTTTLALFLMLAGVLFYQTIDIHKESVLMDIDASSVDLKATSVEHVVATTIPKAFNKALHDAELKAMQEGFFDSPDEAKRYIESKTANITNNYLDNVGKEYKKMGYDFNYTKVSVNITGMPDGFTFTVKYSYSYELKKDINTVKNRSVVGAQNITVKSIIDAYEWYRFKNPYYEKRAYWIEDMSNGNYKVWVKVSIPAGESIKLLVKTNDTYGQNPDEVFEFFDDFEGGSLDESKWKRPFYLSVSINNGIAKVGPANSEGYQTMRSREDFGINTIIEARYEHNITSQSDAKYIGYVEDDDGLPTDTSNYIVLCNSNSSYNGTVGQSSDGNGQSTTSLINPYSNGDWFVGSVIRTANEAIFQENGGSNSISSNIPSKNLRVGISVNYSVSPNKDYVNVDWIRVRKYASKEPTIKVSRINNENAWWVNITNSGDTNLEGYQIYINATNNTSDLSNKVYVKNQSSQLNISQEIIRNNQIYINTENFEMNDYYPSILDRLANSTSNTYKGIVLVN